MNGIEHTVDYLESGLRQFPEGAVRPVVIALLGFTFLWSGIAKARAPWTTAFAVVDFRVARRPSLPIAWAVTSGELGLAAMLLIAPTVSSSFVVMTTGAATCVFLVFSLLIAQALRAGRSFACGCFGSGDEQLTSKALARSGALGLLAISCAAAGSLGAPLTVSELALTWCAGAGALGIGVLLTRSHELARLPRPWGGAET